MFKEVKTFVLVYDPAERPDRPGTAELPVAMAAQEAAVNGFLDGVKNPKIHQSSAPFTDSKTTELKVAVVITIEHEGEADKLPGGPKPLG